MRNNSDRSDRLRSPQDETEEQISNAALRQLEVTFRAKDRLIDAAEAQDRGIGDAVETQDGESRAEVIQVPQPARVLEAVAEPGALDLATVRGEVAAAIAEGQRAGAEVVNLGDRRRPAPPSPNASGQAATGGRSAYVWEADDVAAA